MTEVAAVRVEPARARVYENGWQSWSPTAAYRLDERPHRPVIERNRVICYRPERSAPADAFWGEGLLAVDPGDGGPVRVFAAPVGADPQPSIRADVRDDTVVVSAEGPIEEHTDEADLDTALARWADGYAAKAGVSPPAPAPTAWCSWYHYFTKVTEADIDENLAAMEELDLPIDVAQIDDGYQSEIGDWLTWSERFSGGLPAAVDRIRARGRRAGIWVAPFLVGARSETARRHPDWLVDGAGAGHHWDQDLAALDVTHPDAAAYLTEVFTTLRGIGIDYFKIDFIYAGAVEGGRHDDDVSGLAAYRRGVELIREAIGSAAYLLGCGAPILPSVGLFDAMRVSPDTAPKHGLRGGDYSQPSQLAAELTGRWRAYQHGRFWVNDPDCLIVRPAVEHREEWAAHVERYGGLRASSDRLRDLDDWGLAQTRRLIVPVPTTPFVG